MDAVSKCISKEDIVLFVIECDKELSAIGKIFARGFRTLKNHGIKEQGVICIGPSYSNKDKAVSQLATSLKVAQKKVVRIDSSENVYEKILNVSKSRLVEFIETFSDYKFDCSYFDQQLSQFLVKKDKKLRIGLISRYEKSSNAYMCLENALYIACKNAGYELDLVYLNPQKFSTLEKDGVLKSLDGIVCPGGFGSLEYTNKVEIIKYARENNISFLGICLGLQLLFIEYVRHVLGVSDATSHEFEANKPACIVKIADIKCKNTGTGCYLGNYEVEMEKEGKDVYKKSSQSIFKFRHSYGLSDEFMPKAVAKDLVVGGKTKDGRYAVIINKNHPFMVGVQYHPELTSTFEKIDDVFEAFIDAARK